MKWGKVPERYRWVGFKLDPIKYFGENYLKRPFKNVLWRLEQAFVLFVWLPLTILVTYFFTRKN
jgi:hypothetical protein